MPLNSTSLLKRLPEIRGRYTENAALAKIVWFRAGGAAEVLFRPKDTADLAHFLQHLAQDIPVTILGVGSNILVRDGGIPGVSIRLGGQFSTAQVKGNTLTAGAGALDRTVAMTAAQHNLGGIEFFVGIPGTVGGAIVMNAGAYGQEVKDILEQVTLIDRRGDIRHLKAAECGFSYRHSALPQGSIVLEATFNLFPKPQNEIELAMQDIIEKRADTQPVRARTGGSTFKNPTPHHAWRLIDEAGCRGLRIGDAMVSEKHCNFLLNMGAATATELEAVGEEVRKRVCMKAGIELEWEIKRLGLKKT